MRYLIETNYPKESLAEKKSFSPKVVFKPGWYGGTPYFTCSPPRPDTTGVQHCQLRITLADDPSIDGNLIGNIHVPSGWIMVEEHRYQKLQEDLRAVKAENAALKEREKNGFRTRRGP